MDVLDAAIRDSIPRKTRKHRISPLITPTWKHLIKQKQLLFKKAKSSGNVCDWSNYKQIRNQVKNKIKKEYWKYINSLFSLSYNAAIGNSSRTKGNLIVPQHSRLLIHSFISLLISVTHSTIILRLSSPQHVHLQKQRRFATYQSPRSPL